VDSPSKWIDQTNHPPASWLNDHIVGTIPYAYLNDWGRHGYKENTNIIRGEGALSDHYYLISNVSAPNVAEQIPGLCLLRTDGLDLSQAANWKVWNGSSFLLHPESALNMTSQGLDHNPTTAERACAPVGTPTPQNPGDPPSLIPYSLTWNTYLHKYMLVGEGLYAPPSVGAPGSAKDVLYMLSDDLINWSPAQLLITSPDRSHAGEAPLCLDGVTYPVILDPSDPASTWPAVSNPNFDHPGATPELYFHHKNVSPSTCSTSAGANLARLPIDFRSQRQADINFGTTDPTTGFDDTALLSAGCSTTAGNVPYEGPAGGCAEASVMPPQSAYGKVNTRWEDGSEVWYGAAYYLPDSFFNSKVKARLMRWSGDGGIFGGIQVDTQAGTPPDTGTAYLVRGQSGGSPTEIQHGANFYSSLLHNRWIWIEVHQLLNTTAPSSEVYVNGKLVSASLGPSKVAAGTVNDVSFGLLDVVNGTPPVTSPVTIGVDQATLLGGERGVLGALATPTGLRKAAPPNTIEWNPVPGAIRYRVYRKNTAGAWVFRSDVSGTPPPTSYPDSECTSNSGPKTYRVTSSIALRESNVSSGLTVNCP
jgi:hypothetical protein